MIPGPLTYKVYEWRIRFSSRFTKSEMRLCYEMDGLKIESFSGTKIGNQLWNLRNTLLEGITNGWNIYSYVREYMPRTGMRLKQFLNSH